MLGPVAWQVLLIAVAGGIGAALRALVDARLAGRETGGFPRGTIAVNLSGSFLMGIVAGVAMASASSPWLEVAMVGLLGGYTTFSTAAVQAAEMILTGRASRAAIYAIGLLLGAVALAFAGLWLGSVLVRLG